jgi:hypothetical protein
VSGKKTWKAIYYVGDFPRWYHIGDADAIGWVRTQWPCEKPGGAEAHLKNRYREEYAKKKNKSWQHTTRAGVGAFAATIAPGGIGGAGSKGATTPHVSSQSIYVELILVRPEQW